MSEENKSPDPNVAEPAGNDSFDVPVKRSPWLLFGLLQIPIVIGMIIMLYVMYQAKQNP